MTRPTPTDSGEAVPAGQLAAFGEGRLLQAYRTMTPGQRHIMLQLAELFARQQWTIGAVEEKLRGIEKGEHVSPDHP